MSQIYDLNLHENLVLAKGKNNNDNMTIVKRVPGGWIYTTVINNQMTSCFVPYNKDFVNSEDW